MVTLTGLADRYDAEIKSALAMPTGRDDKDPHRVNMKAALSYAIAFAYMARKLPPNGAPLALSAAQLMTATALTAVALPVAGTATRLNLTAVLAVTILGVFGTGITFYLNYRVLTDEGPTAAATVGYLLPVVSVALGAIFLNEPLTPRIIGGMAIVLAAVALTRRKAQASSSTTAPAVTAAPK